MQHVPRFFVSDDLAEGAQLIISGDNHHHLRHVLRMRAGANAYVFNGRDGEFSAVLEKTERRCSYFSLVSLRRAQADEGSIWLLIGLLRDDVMCFLAEKATELRVSNIVPLMTEHSAHEHCRAHRLRGRAIKAAQQCERLTVPQIHEPIHLSCVESVLPQDVDLYAAIEFGNHPLLWDSLPSRENKDSANHSANRGALLIGPAGGFSDAEAEYLLALRDSGKFSVAAVSLGESLLRSETAALLALSFMYAYF